jgi:diketogulonate reductase-like aldo/keto reductase
MNADPAGMPRLGLGTWRMGERGSERAREVAALQLGLDLGIRLIDTAEMYGDGGAEEVVGEALLGRRGDAYVVSKVYPHNAGARSTIAACERSLKRLSIEQLDCYLLHWRGRIPLAETVGAFERLASDGKIARWGVSNFDVDDMEALFALPDGHRCAVNQVLYHLADRAIEWKLLDWCRGHEVTLMAYSPLAEGGLLRQPGLRALATGLAVTPAQLALAFVLARDGVVANPKASKQEHVREIAAAATISLDADTRAALDAEFPAPTRATRISIV